eukprot:scaffold1440_cov332-Pavlova_lutheri.AAC.57
MAPSPYELSPCHACIPRRSSRDHVRRANVPLDMGRMGMPRRARGKQSRGEQGVYGAVNEHKIVG